MRNLTLCLVSFAMLLLQGALATRIPLGERTPNLIIPVVVYLGVTLEFSLVRVAAIAFVVGYLQDSGAGSPIGLHTFAAVATVFLARGARLALFVRGLLFRVGLTWLIALISGGLVLALRTIFERPMPFAASSLWQTTQALSLSATLTALLSIFVFWLLPHLDAWASRRSDDLDIAWS
ncbi:MAG: rod shape-determining protein MreD [Polyangiales bacterium]